MDSKIPGKPEEGHKWCFDFKHLKILNKPVHAHKQLQISHGNSVNAILLKC